MSKDVSTIMLFMVKFSCLNKEIKSLNREIRALAEIIPQFFSLSPLFFRLSKHAVDFLLPRSRVFLRVPALLRSEPILRSLIDTHSTMVHGTAAREALA